MLKRASTKTRPLDLRSHRSPHRKHTQQSVELTARTEFSRAVWCLPFGFQGGLAMNSPQITHVLFDMDGLLLDTEHTYTVVQQEILQPFGKEFTWELKAKMMGMKATDGANMLITALGLEGLLSAEDFLSQRDAGMEANFLKGVPLLPGAERLINHLSAHGIPIAIATGSHRRHFLLKSGSHTELFSKFMAVVTGDMVVNGKPHPEIFLTAASLLLPVPANAGCCLVFEDAPLGVAAAVAAGMPVVMVPDVNLAPAAFASNGAAAVIASLMEFDPTKFGLPPFSI